ncbi:hypothetical protein [Williamsia sp. DF01-3]|uniref:hypothetical protein n=1 Tax=Williamsia sp. DF01-3 TaxID=2934157 RepID=UPI001FF3EB3D|nr:hypothetical protein [Williamsia sp. DF01-3]MCK0516474.1 hypothetical protein [Williamsia sp. DF01-3]
MGFKFYADGDSNGLIRIDPISGDGEQYQPRADQWRWQPTAAAKTRFSGDYEPVSDAQSRIIAKNMRTRFALP